MPSASFNDKYPNFTVPPRGDAAPCGEAVATLPVGLRVPLSIPSGVFTVGCS
jgi:hypothetical protein